jgi:hypothetical protein
VLPFACVVCVRVRVRARTRGECSRTCVYLPRAENGAVEQPASAMRPFELVRPHDIVEVLLIAHALITRSV